MKFLFIYSTAARNVASVTAEPQRQPNLLVAVLYLVFGIYKTVFIICYNMYQINRYLGDFFIANYHIFL